MKKLKAYAAYSRISGPNEGAILVIAHSVREAKKLAWGYCWNVSEWIDQSATMIRDQNIFALADSIKLSNGEPHVIECPEHCINCFLWGMGITADNLCANCNEPPGDRLLKLYKIQP